MSNAFENLTQSGLAKITSKDDKNVSLSVDSFGGVTGLAVWTGVGGGKPFKINLNRKTINIIKILLRKLQENPAPRREAIFINTFDQESKRMKQVGQLGLGIDDSLTFQIDIAHNDLQGRHIFPVKQHGNFDFSQTSLNEKDILQGLIGYVIDLFSLEAVVAERMSSFKRAPGGGFGGNKSGGGNYGGGGGNRNYANNNNGGGQGGYQQRQQPPQDGGSFGGANDSGGGNVEERLHI